MKAFAPILVLLLAVGALSACGSSPAAQPPAVGAAAVSAAGASNPADQKLTAPDSSGATDPAGGGQSSSLDVCALMPVSTVAMMAGKAVTVSTPDVTSGPDEHMCLYSDAEGGNAMSIWVNATSGGQAFDADLASVGSGAKQVDGVGDKAFSSVLGLEVLSGTTLIKIAGVDDVAAATELAKTLAYQL